MVAPVQAIVDSGVVTPAPSIVTTFGATTGSGNTIFVFTWSDGNKAVTAVTDDATPPNTYAEIQVISGASSYDPSDASIWVSTTNRPAKNITATWGSGTPSNAGVEIGEYPGVWTYSAGATAFNATGSSNPATPTFSNPKAGDLIIGCVAGFYHAGAGFNERLYGNPGLWEDLTASTASSTNSVTGQSGFSGWIALGASFTSASAPAPANSIFFNTD